jgi:hypothetical protein
MNDTLENNIQMHKLHFNEIRKKIETGLAQILLLKIIPTILFPWVRKYSGAAPRFDNLIFTNHGSGCEELVSRCSEVPALSASPALRPEHNTKVKFTNYTINTIQSKVKKTFQ